MDERKFITLEQAIALLSNEEYIHTFRNPAGMLIGADHNRKSLIKTLKSNADKIEIGGELCRNMGHGLIVDNDGFLFIEVDKELLNKFDPIS